MTMLFANEYNTQKDMKLPKGKVWIVLIAYVKGPLKAIEEDRIIIEAGNMGMEIFVPVSVLEALPPMGAEVMVHTYFQVKEDGMSLYGFLNRQDLGMFRQLIGVNGIGPKGALAILSVLGPDQLRMAIVSGDAKAISRAPGVGVKTAQRVILDLKDKIKPEDMLLGSGSQPAQGSSDTGQSGIAAEVAEALTALGYSASEAARAVHKVEQSGDMTAEDMLKASLKHLAF